MANVSGIEITRELRPCKVKNRNALFHQWSDKAEIIPPSLMKGGHAGGVVKATLGLVEFEDGRVTEVYPHEIRFLDRKVQEFYFDALENNCEKQGGKTNV